MEKFSKWRDRGSGIAPFLPIPGELPVSGFILAVLRLPVFILTSVLLVLFSWAIPASLIKYFLFLPLGIVLDVATEKKHASLDADVIISNWTSPLDGLVLFLLFRKARFVKPYTASEKVSQTSLIKTVLESFTLRAQRDGLPISKIPSPILILAECTTSNGRGILELSPALKGLSPGMRVQCVHIKYTPANIVTPLTHTYLSFVMRLLATPFRTIRVRISSPEVYKDMNSLPDEAASILARLGRVKRLAMGAQDKASFLKAWKKRT